MFEFATGLFDPTGFPPRKECGTGWTPALIFLHVTSDLFIWLAYLSIPLVLLYFTRRRDLPFPKLFVLFALFILACGTTHLIDALIFEYPVYRFAGLMKGITAVVSWATVIALVPVIPRVMHAVTQAAQPGAVTREHRALTDADLAPPESRQRAYIVALLAGILAVLVRATLDPLLEEGDYVFVVALLAVVYVSWRHGFGPAVLCLCVGVFGYTYFFIPPRGLLYAVGLGNQLALALFFFCGAACAALGEAQRQAARRARVALATATARTQELEAEVFRRRSAEGALRTSEGRLRAFYDNSPVCMGVVELLEADVRHVYDNRASCAFFGVGTEGTAGRRASELGTPPAVLQLWLGKYRLSGERQEAVHFEYEYQAADGQRWLSATVSPLEASDDGGPPLFCYVAEDVTARRRAEEDLRDSEARFRTLAQAVPHIIWVTRPDGYHEYYNDRWYAYTGLTPEQSIGHRWSGPLHPDDVARSQARWKEATDSGEEYEIEYRFRGADGRYRWFLGRALPQRSADGHIVRWYGTCTDIHNEKLATESVRRNEERFRLLTEAVPHIVWNADAGGEITYFNRRWREFTAVPLEQTGGRGWLGAVHPDDRDRVFAAWRNTVERDTPGAGDRFQHELRLKDARGGYRWFQTVAVPLRRADGSIDQWIGSMADIHDQKTAAETVRGLNEQLQLRMDELRSVLDAAPAAIWISHDPECRTITGNRTAADLLHATTADNVSATVASGRGFREVGPDGRPIPPDRLPMQRAAREAAAVIDADLSLVFDDGRVRHILGNAVPLRDAAGRPRGAVAVFVDVTDRKRAEADLRASEARFRLLTEAVPQMVWTADLRGEVTFFNRRWDEYTGLPLELGRKTAWQNNPLHPDDADRVRASWQLAVAQGAASYSCEFRLRAAASGEYRWMLSAAVPLRDPAGAITEWVGALTDIDDQKRQAHTLERMVRERTSELEAANSLLTTEVKDRQAAESQVREVAAELERSNGELEKFAYVASHDLQEPLRKIQAFGDRLRGKCRDQLSDPGKEYVDRMMSAAGRMRRLIDDLLTFSRVTTQKKPYVRLNLDKLVREVVSDLDVRITQVGGTVGVGPLPQVDADPTQMRQLFQNLIANAVKFHRPGVPPVVEVGCEPAEIPDNEAVRPGYRIWVRDNGIGFDEKYRDRIFNVFQRLHGRDQYEGTGVGLAICRKIAERHGGQITARSKEGEGATFVITLPAVQNHTREATSDDD